MPTEGDLRLMDGDSEDTGRLEIFHDNTWGSICDDRWPDGHNAKVACNQLGYPYVNLMALWVHLQWDHGIRGHGPQPTQPIWLDNVVCDGTEAALTECQANDWRVNDCTHFEDVGISCLGGISCF